MTAGTFLVALTLVVLVLLLWHLRWVLLVLFGAVVVAVALDHNNIATPVLEVVIFPIMKNSLVQVSVV